MKDFKLATTISAKMHNNAKLKESNLFDNYLIDTGNKVIFELIIKKENTDVTDAVSWTKVFFYFKDTIRKGQEYYFQNDDQLTDYCYIGGAWSGIKKLYGLRGSFNITNYSDSCLEIKINGIINADKVDTSSFETTTLIKDTVIKFKND